MHNMPRLKLMRDCIKSAERNFLLGRNDMEKPMNPYKKGTIVWKVMQGSLDDWPDGGWADLTPSEIAEVLGANLQTVRSSICQINRETGYYVPHIGEKKRRYGYE